MTSSRSPIELRATYRLQLSSDFGFADARALVPYLRDLGISHLYLSPSLQARRGSTHGYDVVDPRHFSRELGGPEQLRALSASARDAGMGIVLDVVPNHMAADAQNRYWADPSLRAKFFDIEPGTGVYRRFFDIGELAGVRQEDPAVFEETHELVISLVREGVIDGLRVDHPDGLADPAGYLARLREHGVERVWIEKILDPGERLRDWPVCGTVGYEFLDDVCALFVDPDGKPALTALWEQVSGDRRSFAEIAHAAKLEQVRGPFRQDVERLARELGDVPVPGGLDALGHALASVSVYRTYVEPWNGRVDDADRRVIEASGMDPEIAAMLLLESDAPPGFVTRFQQTTPAITAKGVEDTAFYRYCRLISLNDVGGDPSRFGIDVGWFHASCVERLERFPLNLLTTQTHDAKRSADVRARIDALSSVPDEWAAHVARWFELTDSSAIQRRARRRRALLPVPDARRRLADRRRPDRGVHGEGAPRGKAEHQLDRAERRLGGGGQAIRRARCTPTMRSWRTSSRSRGGWPRSASAPRSASSCSSSPPPGSRHVRGRRARGSERSSIPITAGRSTSTGARRCCAG